MRPAVIPRPDRVVCVVLPGQERPARELLGTDLTIVTVGGPLIGNRISLLLRTHPGIESDPWERLVVRSRLLDHCRFVTADLETLAAILGAIRTTAPWVLEGAPPRRLYDARVDG